MPDKQRECALLLTLYREVTLSNCTQDQDQEPVSEEVKL